MALDQESAIQQRIAEVAQYQQNINLYSAIASALPSEWPDHLRHLKGASNKHAAIADLEDLDDVALVSDLWAHDEAVAAIRTETVEMRKAQAILNALQA